MKFDVKAVSAPPAAWEQHRQSLAAWLSPYQPRLPHGSRPQQYSYGHQLAQGVKRFHSTIELHSPSRRSILSDTNLSAAQRQQLVHSCEGAKGGTEPEHVKTGLADRRNALRRLQPKMPDSGLIGDPNRLSFPPSENTLPCQEQPGQWVLTEQLLAALWRTDDEVLTRNDIFPWPDIRCKGQAHW